MEVVAGLIAVVVVLLGFFMWQLSKGPVSFGRFTPQIEKTLSQAYANLDVKIQDAVVAWSEDDRSAHFRVVGVDLFDSHGTLIGHIPQVEIDLAVSALLQGRITPSRVEIFGPSATIVRTHDGNFELGFGQEADTFQSPSVAKDKQVDRAFNVLTDLLSEDAESSGPMSALETFTISDAKIELLDQQSGSLWVAPKAVVSLSRGESGIAWDMRGDVKVGMEEVSVAMQGDYDSETDWIYTALEFTDVTLSSFAAKSTFFEALGDFQIPVSGKAKIQIDNEGELRAAEFELGVGQGSMRIEELGEETIPVDYGAFSATYDGERQWFDIRRLHYVAGENRATLIGSAKVTFETEERLQLSSFRFDLSGQDLSFDIPRHMKHVVAFDDLRMEGVVDLVERWARIEELFIQIGEGHVQLSGDVYDSIGAPAVIASGSFSNIPVEKIDILWPKNLALGARDWVTQNIEGGVLPKGILTINAPPGVLAQKPIGAEYINLDFSIADASVSYLGGMPRMIDAAADVKLTVETFDLTLRNGRVVDEVKEPIKVAAGSTVSIEELHVRGSPILIAATLDGRTEDILTLVDHEPLGYLKRFGVKPSDIGGVGEADLWFSIPLLRHVPRDRIGFKATGQIKQLVFPNLIGDLGVDGGELTLDINLDGLKGHGNIEVAGIETALIWTEDFNAGEGDSSVFHLTTLFNDTAQEKWGLSTGGSMTGEVPVILEARGRGPNISSIDLSADLTAATIVVESIDFEKPEGEASNAKMRVTFGEDGDLNLKNFVMGGDRLGINGSLRLASTGRLEKAAFERIWIDDLMDVEFHSDRGPDGELNVSILGEYLNVSPFMSNMMADLGGQPKAEEVETETEPSAWNLKGEVADLYLRGGVALHQVKLDVANSGEKFTELNVTGRFEDDGEVYAAITPGGQSNRHLVVTASDGGRIIQGITGVDQVKGGNFSLKMELNDQPMRQDKTKAPPTMAEYFNNYALAQQEGSSQSRAETETTEEDKAVLAALEDSRVRFRSLETESSAEGYLRIDDFKVVQAPILARLLTVASFQGMGSLLQGEGIQFDSLDAPFWVDEEGVIGISDASASGPSLGLTLFGTFDQGTNETDLQGTIVPSYGINSALGKMPIFGPILVSREGEGVFAFTYGIAGPTDGPTVFVNPLSGLAPGFLRRVFQPRGSQEAHRVPVEKLEDLKSPSSEDVPSEPLEVVN